MQHVKTAFEKLMNAKTIPDVENVLSAIHEKFWMKDGTYHKIEFKITKEEIQELKKLNAISEKNHLVAPKGSNALIKLLYAVLWKRGDLKKVKHVIEGILSEVSDEPRKSLVF